ncbi:helix-turn-helix domain-containing protein [Ruminococcaceae bacterium OttesenSCG-928-L11]|nr:helix-turn-helix domain-containing protein [Ruminococcaceae bacterium OttesenSCG-928-L11]
MRLRAQQLSGRLRRQKIATQYFLSYLLLIALFVACSVWVLQQFDRNLRSAAEESGMADLVKTGDLFEQKLGELRNVAYAISMDSDIRTIASMPVERRPSDYIVCYRVLSDIKRYYVSNNTILDIHIWFPGSEMSKIRESFFPADQSYLETHYLFDGVDYRRYFQDAQTRRPSDSLAWSEVTIVNDSHPALLYYYDMKSFPEGANGYLFIEMSTTSIQSLLSVQSSGESGGLVALDSSDTVIYAQDPSLAQLSASYSDYKVGTGSVRRNGTQILHYKPSSSGLLYLLYLPDSYFHVRTGPMRNLLWSINIALVVCAFLLAIYLTRRHSAPIRSIVSAFSGSVAEQRGNEIDSISRSVDTLLKNKEELENALRRQLTVQREAYFTRLLRGAFISEEQAVKAGETLDISDEYPLYAAAFLLFLPMPLVEKDGPRESHVSEFVIASQMLRDAMPTLLCTYQTSNGNLSLVFGCGYEDDGSFEQAPIRQLEAVTERLWRESRISAYCGVGVPRENMFHLSASQREARYASESCDTAEGMRVVCARYTDTPSSPLHYPLESEVHLLRSCRTGDLENATAIADELFEKTLSGSGAGVAELTQLAYSFRGTFLRTLAESPGHSPEIIDRIGGLITADNPEKLRDTVMDLLALLCDIVNQNKQEKRGSLYDAIVQYIQEHFQDASLSLTSTADYFNINEKYLSHFFKEVSGEKFSTAVERIRMNYALEQMKETVLPISQICTDSGYSGTNSFYKAFKRIYRMSPNAYRQAIQSGGAGGE